MKNFFQRLKFAVMVLLPGLFNRYEAASWSTWKSWIPGGLQDARLDISKATREELMRKARYFEKNSAIARRLGAVYCDYTVGSNGMVFTPSSSDPAWNEKALAYIEKTCSVIDFETRQTFGSLQQLIAWRDLFDGDIFIIKTKGQDNQGRWWPRIQIIEGHLCATPPTRQAEEGKTIFDGVEAPQMRPIAYWFKAASDDETYRRVEASSVIHILDPDRASQKRGISGFAAAINYLHRLEDLQELEFRALTNSAEHSTFIETETGQMPPGMGSGIPGDGFGTSSPVTGQTLAARQSELREAVGGKTVALKLGEKVSQFQPQRPTDATRNLWSYLTSCVCASVGVPKMLCFSEWLDGAQGTIVRGDYNIASQFFKAHSAVYAAAFREVIIYVLQWGIQSERGLQDPPANWMNLSWTSPRDINVDIGHTSEAKLRELEAGTTTFKAIYGEMGLNWMTELEQKAKEAQFIRDLATKYEVDVSEISRIQVDPIPRTNPGAPQLNEPQPVEP